MTARAAAWVSSAFVTTVCLAYWVRFGGHSWHPTDYEMVVGFSWRVFAGKVPYRDFLYVRTPLTLYMHAAWFFLPDGWQVRASRLGYFLQFAVAAAVPMVWAVRSGTVRFGWRLPFLAVLFCVVGMHNFPVMPWYTVDGILFGSLGLTAGVASLRASTQSRRVVLRVLCSIAFACAVMTKQNFAALSMLLAMAALLELAVGLARKKEGLLPSFALFAASIGPGALVVGCFVAWLHAVGAWDDFVHQVLGLDRGAAVNSVAYEMYVDPTLLPMLGAGLAAGLSGLLTRGKWLYLGRAIVVAMLGLLACQVVRLALRRYDNLGHQVLALVVGLIVGTVVADFLAWRRGAPVAFAVERFALALGMVAIAWSSGISWGYKTPILGLVAMGVVVHALLPLHEKHWFDFVPEVVATVVVVAAFVQANDHLPYRDHGLRWQTENLGAIFPKLQGIYSSPGMRDRYEDAKALIDKYVTSTGRPFIVLPELAGIHWLTNTQNPIGIDWAWAPDFDRSADRLVREIDASKPVALIMKEQSTSDMPLVRSDLPCRPRDKLLSKMEDRVLDGSTLLGEGKYFCVYSVQ